MKEKVENIFNVKFTLIVLLNSVLFIFIGQLGIVIRTFDQVVNSVETVFSRLYVTSILSCLSRLHYACLI